MDYYERLKQAYVIIDKEVSEATPVTVIEYKIATKLGLGPTVVNKRINQLKAVSKLV